MVLKLDEITDFITKAENKIQSAKTLFEIGHYGDSVSLSYYAMFLAAKALVIKKGGRTNTHQGTITEFGKIWVHEDNFSYEKFVYLASTQSLREEVDYNSTDRVNQKIAKEKIKQAEEFLQETKKFL